MKARLYSSRIEGDMIVVSIINDNNVTLFKGAANIKDKKAIKKLMVDLESKGFNIKSGIDWLD